MENIYQNGILSREIYINSADVNKHRKLKASRLFEYFQSLAMDHINMIDCGSDKTINRGILWIIASQQLNINRMPRYEETIILKTWPGKKRHNFFQRHYRIETTSGELLLESVSVWGLINAGTRKLVNPDDYDISVEPVDVTDEMSMLGGPKPVKFTSHSEFKVPFSYIDLNGHLNNARYMDIIDDTIPAASQGLEPRFINARYGTETLEDEIISINWGNDDASYYASIDSGAVNHFKIRIEY